MKILLIVIDGLGDRPIPELGNKTPLEAAKTPNLDWLAKNGICGEIRPFQFSWQEYPASDTTHLALLGYDPKIYYLGRGPYEAAGIGIKLKEGDIALRANFATINENLNIINRRAGRIEKTQPLIKAINGIEIEGLRPSRGRGVSLRESASRPDHHPASGPLVKFILRKSYGHRAVLVLRGLKPDVRPSEKISDNDPKFAEVRPLQIKPLDRSKEAKFTAMVLNEFLKKAYLVLKNHPLNKKREKVGLLPANYLLVRGAGKMRKTPSFKERYNLRAGCIAGGGLYKGIGKILGMDEILVKGATGFPTTNLKRKFIAAKKNLKKYDFIFLHIKAADNLAEDGNFLGKKEFIERIDRSIKPVLSLKGVRVVITADHSTSCILKKHCKDPVPVLIKNFPTSGSRKGRRQVHPVKSHKAGIPPSAELFNGVKQFSERTCKKGKLGKFSQLNLMSKILC